MLINTLLVKRTIEQEGLWGRLSAEDYGALTPLFHGHINPLWPVHTRSGTPVIFECSLVTPVTRTQPCWSLKWRAVVCHRSFPPVTPIPTG